MGGSLRNEWINWRAKTTSDFLSEVRDVIVKANPRVILSANVPSSLEWNKQAMGVDWADWVQRGPVDKICPMLYHRDSGMPIRWIRDISSNIFEQVKAWNGKPSVLPCVGRSISTAGNMQGSEWAESVKEAMRGGVQGVTVFADVCVDRSDGWENLRNLFGEAWSNLLQRAI